MEGSSGGGVCAVGRLGASIGVCVNGGSIGRVGLWV
jgi:hypothetical protein